MGSQSDWATMRHAAETLDALGIAHDRRIVSAHRTPDRLYAFRQGRQGGGLQGDHRRRRRRRAPARHDRGADAAAGVRRAGRIEGAVRPGFAAFDRADAGRHSGRHAGDRQGRRDQCRAACRRRAGARPTPHSPTGSTPWRAQQTGEGRRAAVGRANERAARRPARRSASSAAASSAACWRWPPPASATARSSSSRRPTARRRRSPTGRSSPPMTIRPRSPNWRAPAPSSPTNSRTCRSPPANAACRERAGLSAAARARGRPGPAGRKALPQRGRHIHSAIFFAVDNDADLAAALAALRRQRRAEDPPPGL